MTVTLGLVHFWNIHCVYREEIYVANTQSCLSSFTKLAQWRCHYDGLIEEMFFFGRQVKKIDIVP